MLSKVLIFSLCAGAAALTLQADDPVDFHENEKPIEFSVQYRMNLVRQMQAYTFDDFMSEHDKDYKKDSDEFKKRAALFYQRKAETIRLAGLHQLTWTPAMNKFLDQDKKEISQRLGYRPMAKNKHSGINMARQPLEDIPETWSSGIDLDWRPNMTYSVDFNKDQGACGSCWAVATTSAIEAYADIKFHMSVPLSDQQLVSCTPNLKHCGGKGGCDGATCELALDYLHAHGGIVAEQNYKYTSLFGDSGICDAVKSKSPTVLIGGYKSVPSNNLQAMMYAVTQGPVVVAVDASPWSFYGGGVFNSCKKDATLNHAVVLVGYGLQGVHGYWTIRNSWGPDWGENGYIKLGRSTTAKFATFCGMDNDPEQGSACEGDKTPVKVCGMCGILYEAVVPIVTGVNRPHNFDAIIEGVKKTKLSFERKRMARKIKH